MRDHSKFFLNQHIYVYGSHSIPVSVESTDILNSAQLIVFIRYSSDGKRNAVLRHAPEWMCTGEDIFTKLKEPLLLVLSSENCISMCVWGQDWSDAGEKKGLKVRVLQVAPHVNFTLCIIHRESLASKTLEPKLKHILDIAIKMVNYIKTHPLHKYRAQLNVENDLRVAVSKTKQRRDLLHAYCPPISLVK